MNTYERFSDRARKVLQLANQEARRWNHEYIGTEHLLSGLLLEGCGVAAMALKNLGVFLPELRCQLEKLIQRGPDMVTFGKLPQTPRVKRAIGFAEEEARTLGHNYIGTEHLLLGLLREQEGLHADLLTGLGITPARVKLEVQTLLGVVPPDLAEIIGRISAALEDLKELA